VTQPGIAKATAPFRAINNIARLVLTGTVDTGWGAIQLQTLMALNPALWGEAMGRGFYNMFVEPKQLYRFLGNSKAAARYATYGGNVGVETEFFQATRMGLPRAPGPVQGAVDVATFPARTFINRLQVGFESTLLYGRVLAFDAMYEAAVAGGKATVTRALGRVAGAPRQLEGAEFHDEMFRLARFVDTMVGQPKLGGIITQTQAQVESAFVWFATRYTRSVAGTMATALGKGFAPAQARVLLAKMMLGGAAIYAGLTGALGEAQGKSPEEVQEMILRGLNPMNGKEFVSWKIGGDWFGLGGAYRSYISMFAGLGDKDSWEFAEYESKLWDNPFIRGLRTRTAPTTGTLMDLLEGEDFLGYPISLSDLVDNPSAFGDYAVDNFAPITMDALMQDMSWKVQTPRFIAEFFGLRTSPETRFEAETAVMNRVSNDLFGVPFDALEHNMLAQDAVRSHNAVRLVSEGILGVPRERERDKQFRLWEEKRTRLREASSDAKHDLDAAVTGVNLIPTSRVERWLGLITDIPQTARMDGRVYREQYGDQVAADFHELEGLKTGFGFQFTDEEAPEATVDFIMNQYFDRELEDYVNSETGQPDWDAWFADGDAILEQLPEEWKQPADAFLHQNSTEIRRDFQRTFEEVIEPSGYFRVREHISELLGDQLGFTLNSLEDAIIDGLSTAERRASPADVGREVDKVLNLMLEQTLGAEAPTVSVFRNLIREVNPRLDVELYRQGYVTTVRSPDAIDLARQMMEETAPRKGYFIPPLAGDVADRIRREQR
jgi:hypothetical protein